MDWSSLFKSIFDTEPKLSPFEKLSLGKPRDFQLHCCEWLQKRGYRAYRGRYGARYAFVGRPGYPGNFVPSDYTIFIFINRKGKGRSAEPDEIGKCKFGKNPATKKDLLIFIENMGQYEFTK